MMRSTSKAAWLVQSCALVLLFAFAGNLSAQGDASSALEEQLCLRAKAAENDGIAWEPDLKTAMAKAKKLDKPVLVVFLCRFLGNCNSPYA